MSKIIDDVVHELYGIEAGRTEIGFLADFTLLWSIFESKINKVKGRTDFNGIIRYISTPAFKKLINVKTIHYLPAFILLKISENSVLVSIPNIDFETILYPEGSRLVEIPDVKKHFKSIDGVITNTEAEIIDLLFLITYRIRNNVFHGIKNFYHLSTESAFFDIINKFLVEVLIITKDK